MAELAESLAASEDDRLDQAESAVRDYCRWHIGPTREDVEAVFTDPTARRLFLPTLLLLEVTEVIVEGDAVPVDLDMIHVDPAGWIEPAFGQRWPGTWVAPLRLTVTYSHGYDEIPPSVTGVVQALAQRSIGNPRNLKSEQAGPFSESYGTPDLSADEMIRLAPYRLSVMA